MREKMTLKDTYEKYKHFSQFIHDVKKSINEFDEKQGYTENLSEHIMCDCFIAIEEELKRDKC